MEHGSGERAPVPIDDNEVRERFAAIVRGSEDGIVGKTLDGIVTSWNPAAERLFGYTAEEMVGRPLARIVPPERRAELAGLMARVRRGERVEHFETERVRKDGGRLHISVSISPIRDETGRITGAASIKRDVTERVRNEAERARLLAEAEEARARAEAAREVAEAAVRARDEFLAVAAHELKTPVTSLRGYAQMLARRLERGGAIEPGRLRDGLEAMDYQSSRLARLVEQLLDVARLETGALPLHPRPTDLAQLVGFAVAEAKLGTDRHTFAVRAAEGARATVDPLRFEQVLANLLGNAVKYSPRGGQVDVHLERGADGSLRLAVRDRGVGVPPALRGRLFERFFRADPDSAVPGLGVGLYVSRQIVERHGGAIRAEFPEDGGTRFVVELPTPDPAPPEEATRPVVTQAISASPPDDRT